MRGLFPLLALACATSLVGCASGGSTLATTADTPQRRTVAAPGANLTVVTEASTDVTTFAEPVDRVWTALRVAYDSLGVPVGTLDPATRTIGNLGFKTRNRLGKTPLSRHLDCGSTQVGPNADSYDIILSVMSSLQPAPGGGTRLTTTVEAQARPATFNQSWSRCSSRGGIEERVASLVKAQLLR
jgi:hypothetical protein